jgi:hypothetical protein
MSGLIEVTTQELYSAAGVLRGAEQQVAPNSISGVGGLGAADIGSPELSAALLDFSESLQDVTAALARVLMAAAETTAAAGGAYDRVEAANIPVTKR